MKYLPSIIIPSLFLALAITGCKDGKGTGSFTANIDGQSWSAIAPTGAKTGNRLTITGLSLDKQIVINIANTATGTYDMSLIEGSINPLVYVPNVNQQAAQSYLGASGTIEVTEINDSRVSGTFSVSATNTGLTPIAITGEFTDVKYF